MFKTALAQLRLGLSIAFGWPFAHGSLDALIDALVDTRREFGAIENGGDEMLAGPVLDEEMRRDVQLRRFRAQAVHAARETPYYASLFESLRLDPTKLTWDDIARLPYTPKETLRDSPDQFVRRGACPAFRTTTTGTTGWPTAVYFSHHEMRVYSALNAIAFLRLGQLAPEDLVLISTSSRATLGNTCFAQACQRIGATWMMGGLVEPALTLDLLAEKHDLPGHKRQVSFLNIYPSYLGQLVETGLAMGYRPGDFGLERISVGGEIVTPGLKRRAAELFGPVKFIEGYGITEIWPVGGTLCSQGHLHFEPSQGLVEIKEFTQPSTLSPQPSLGTLVATPFPPYRDTTVVLRFDTGDVVQPVIGALTCEHQHLPATSTILGKRRLCVEHEQGVTVPRDVIEALEDLDAVPLPARFGCGAAPGGVAVEVVTREQTGAVRSRAGDALEARGIPLRALRLVEDPSELTQPYPLRCDLRETSFKPTLTHPAPNWADQEAARISA
ncbi:MAG: AMP-binding protein [Anaerolineae bacterium]|nr:AMP-binding protein [Anaerolineae bacterium]